MTLSSLKIKICLFTIITMMMSCSSPKTNTENIDSTKTNIDSAKIEAQMPEEIVEEAEPELIEPPIDSIALASPQFDFYPSTNTSDEKEEKLVTALAKVMDEYNAEKYVTIKMSYTHPDPVVDGKIHEEETWYYNAERQLRGYTLKYKSERATQSKIYLFNENDLLAVHSDYSFSDEGSGFTENVKAVDSPLCPNCGLSISTGDETGETTITVVSISDYYTDFFSSYKYHLENYKGVKELVKQDGRYMAYVIETSMGSDSIKYSVDPNLIQKFFKKAAIKE
jgi:hypothetical protein